MVAAAPSQNSCQKGEKGRKAKEKAHYRMPVPHLIEGLSSMLLHQSQWPELNMWSYQPARETRKM